MFLDNNQLPFLYMLFLIRYQYIYFLIEMIEQRSLEEKKSSSGYL